MTEYVSAPSNTGPLDANTWTPVAAIDLSAGDWDISGYVTINVAASTPNQLGVALGTASGAVDGAASFRGSVAQVAETIAVGPFRVVVDEGAEWWLNVYSAVGSDAVGGGLLQARRMD